MTFFSQNLKPERVARSFARVHQFLFVACFCFFSLLAVFLFSCESHPVFLLFWPPLHPFTLSRARVRHTARLGVCLLQEGRRGLSTNHFVFCGGGCLRRARGAEHTTRPAPGVSFFHHHRPHPAPNSFLIMEKGGRGAWSQWMDWGIPSFVCVQCQNQMNIAESVFEGRDINQYKLLFLIIFFKKSFPQTLFLAHDMI